MTDRIRLAAFGGGLVVAFAAAFGLGALFGPGPAPARTNSQHMDMDMGSRQPGSDHTGWDHTESTGSQPEQHEGIQQP